MRCIKCGIEKGKKPFIGVFCADCYNFPIKKPKPITIEKCKRCGRYKIKGEWKKLSEEKLEDFLGSRVRAEFDEFQIDIKRKKAILIFYVEGYKTERKINYDVEIKTVLCRDCSRLSAGYFEAIIQLRGNPLKIEKKADYIIKQIYKKGAFVAKIEEKKEGLDLYVSSSKKALEVIKENGYTHKISRKLHGLKEGKRVYRTTIALRF